MSKYRRGFNDQLAPADILSLGMKQGAKAELREWRLHIPTRLKGKDFRIPRKTLGAGIKHEGEEIMKPSDIKIQLTDEAFREFKEIQEHPHALVSDGGKRYLRQLIKIPLERWQIIQRHWYKGAFRSDHQLPFDIRGLVCYDGAGRLKTVLITRFKWKGRTGNAVGWGKRTGYPACGSVWLN